MGLIAVASLAATAIGSTKSKTISVAIVANPQMQDIASLTPSLFTAKNGIKVKYTILDEGKLRQVTTRDVGSGGKAFDAVMIGMYEAPQFGTNGWLVDLTPYATDDASYDIDDLLPAVRAGLSVGDSMYASPFYAESSFLMYRQDVLDAAGIEMPAKPTTSSPPSRSRGLSRTWTSSSSPATATCCSSSTTGSPC